MTEHDITIGTKTDPKNGVNLISVSDQWVTVKSGDSVVFRNALNGAVDATVSFYATPGKTTAISGFCKDKAGTALTVPAGGEAKCGITLGGAQSVPIAYSVDTSVTDPMKHVALDPVIIIQPELRISLPDLGFASGFAAILLLVIIGLVLLAAGFGLGRR